jgi:hypothetical protein
VLGRIAAQLEAEALALSVVGATAGVSQARAFIWLLQWQVSVQDPFVAAT